MRERRTFTDEYRAEVVALFLTGDRSIYQVAHELDLTESVVRAWVRKARSDNAPAPKPNGALVDAEREELLRLRKENV